MDVKGMREILFRGKRLSNGEWVYGFIIKVFGTYCIIDKDYDKHIAYKIIPETVGQYTGLTDKNGKKIFEGDIMAFTAYGFDYVGTVEFAYGCASVMCEHATPFLDQAVSKHGAYIIGNMHDNPELLNGAE